MQVVELARELVRIPSENPSGSEQAIASYISKWMNRLPGVEVINEEVLPGRSNVLGILKGEEKRCGLAYLGHMDTVPSGPGWTYDPFGGIIKEGKLYGRGAADMKGGLAAILMTLSNLALSGQKPKHDFLVCATIDEEGPGMLGAVDLVKKNYIDNNTLVVATEPTGNELHIFHKGLVWYEICVKGKNAHAGNPEQGVDAVYGMSLLLTTLKKHLQKLNYNHPILGRPSLTCAKIRGGLKTNIVPAECIAEIDLRLVPPMTLHGTAELIEKVLNGVTLSVPGLQTSFRQINNDRPPIEANPSSPVIGAFQEAYRIVTGNEIKIGGFPAYTDASIISSLTSNPHCVLFGPGHLEQAHTTDEFIPIKELVEAEKVLTEAAKILLY
ncbi:MAG: M20 family metallopeptidase [Thermacetogeniaceae bacterium]|nr:M20 family metallopeptidase [Syntrophomonadaceae bacterium]